MTLTLRTSSSKLMASKIREGEVEREVQAQFSEVLARVAMNPDHSRQLHEILGEYFHQSRNLLNTLKISVYLAMRTGSGCSSFDWRSVESNSQKFEQFIERMQWICRPVPIRCVELPLALLFEGRIAAWSELLAKSGRKLIVEPPDCPAVGRFDPTRLERVFDDLVSWRILVGDPANDLRLRWSDDSVFFRVDWDEPASRRVFPIEADLEPIEPNENLSDCLRSLAVPSLFRVISQHGGSVSGSIKAPFEIRVSWPLNATTT